MNGDSKMNIENLKVLVCDDSILARKNVVNCIKELGCTDVLEATNGQEAIDIYKTEKPDIVFMDIVMPVKTGLEALIEILGYNEDAKVIIASSSGTQSHIKSAIDAGANNFIQKPISAVHVKKIIENICRGDE